MENLGLDIENWKRIKEEMEKAGKTDNYYYKRACVILKKGKDPFG